MVFATFAFVVVYYFVDPFPPRHITIGCGPAEGANFGYAQAYREILSKKGIRLELRNKAGSAENLKLLEADSGGLEGIEEKVSNISVPLSFSEELYHLRMHIDMLRNKLKLMIEN